ncbi:MAG TPA: FmdB family zinc ribbon protein [Pseudonocardiaceae bacterium]|nr:FmdB family zinc ribbon protein [Pseudonocardiaceae bacterium]
MPTYSYACTACEHHFDTVQKFTDPSLTDCPECSGRLRKLFSSVGIVFKGSGFYRTDSRTSNSDKPISYGKSESSNKDQAGSKQSEAGSSSDSKAGSGSTSSTASVSTSSSAS